MKQTFEIPEGCNRVTIEQQGRQIITTFEPEFKEGDVLFVEKNMTFFSTVFIFKKNIYNDRNEMYAGFVDGKFVRIGGIIKGFPRHATESEKQQLFDALKKRGKRWNAEAKQVEDIKPKRWRAKENGHYWHLDSQLNASRDTEHGLKWDDMRYISGNYFISDDDAELAAEKIKELLKQINP